MKTVLLVVVAMLLVNFKGRCQIEKGNWLFGGNATFSSAKTSSDLGSQTYRSFRVAGTAGYFVIDKLVTGVRPDLVWDNVAGTGQNGRSNRSSIGPFIRYYLLPVDSRVNFLLESYYLHGISKASSNKFYTNTYGISGGPVFFLNSAVGLELLVGYNSERGTSGNIKTNTVQTGIGLQFHLTKDDY